MQNEKIPLVALSRNRYNDKWIPEGAQFFVDSESDADDMVGIRPPIARHLTPEERAKLAAVQNGPTMAQAAPVSAASVRPAQPQQTNGGNRHTITANKRR